MKFEARSGLILFSDDRPGSHVTMFVSSGKLPFRMDVSSFDDRECRYTWGFELAAPIKEGKRFVFATADREVVGRVVGEKIEVVLERVTVEREDGNGKPLRVVEEEKIEVDGAASVVIQAEVTRLISLGLPKEFPVRGMRCMFVNPVIPYNQWACYKSGVMNEASFSAHGSAYVSAALKNQGHQTWLVDFRSMSGWAHVEQVLRQQEYDIAFVGFLSIDVFHAAAAVRLLKELHPNRPVVVGGLHVSIAKEREFPRPDLVDYYCWGNQDLLPDSFKQFLAYKGEGSYSSDRYPQADYVILDDGEIAAQNLVADLAAGRRPSKRTIEGGAVPMEVARHMDRDLFRLDFEAHSPILPFQPTPMVTVTWARGCPFHCAYSMTGDTVVFTDNGPVELASLMKGIALARVCAHGGQFMEYRLSIDVASPSGRSRATWGVDEGVRPILRVESEGGLHVKATPEHQFMCAVDDEIVWRRADELKVGDFMVVRQPEREWPTVYSPLAPPNVEPYLLKRHGFPHVLDESLAWLTGFLVGDGCLPRDGRAVVHFCVPPNAAKHQEIVERVFGTPLHIYPFEHTDKQFQGQIHSRIAREVFVQSLGVDPEDKLKIPAIFWRAPKAVFAAFVDGLFEADGYHSDENGLYLTTVSERLARDVAYALLMLGRGCPNIVTIDPVNADGSNRGRCYRVGVLANDRIPTTHGIYRSTKSSRWYWRTHKGPDRLGLRRRTLREAGLHHPLDRDGWYYVRVRDVTPCPAEPVYDITVPDGEAFVANGFVAHNCNLASQLSNTNVREKPVELVEEELDDLHRRFGGRIGSLMIHDDLTFHPKHIAQWCELILRKYGPIPIWMQTRADWIVTRYRRDRPFWELLCRAGLTWTSVGYESGSQRMLDFMQKDSSVEKNLEAGRILDEYGINSFGNFLWGCPTETREEADQTVRLVEQIKPGFLSGSVYCNYPGTQMDAWCRANDVLVGGTVYTRSHLPWQVTVKGIDYGYVNDCVRRAGTYANYLRMPKFLSEDRKRDLAASSRGLVIH